MGGALRPRATRLLPRDPLHHFPRFFSPANFPGPVPGGRSRRGACKFPLQTGEIADPHPSSPRPPPPRPRTRGRFGSGKALVFPNQPPPRGGPEKGTAPGARPARGPERKKLIIDWVIGVAGAPNGPRTRARAGLRGRGGAGSPTGAAAQRDDPRAVAAERQPEQERRGRRRIDVLRARLRLPGQLAGRERGGRGGAGSGRCWAAGRGLETAAGP